jgi:hypothetical protein
VLAGIIFIVFVLDIPERGDLGKRKRIWKFVPTFQNTGDDCSAEVEINLRGQACAGGNEELVQRADNDVNVGNAPALCS